MPITISTEKAEKIVLLLQTLHAISRGEDKRMLAGLIKDIGGEVKAQKKADKDLADSIDDEQKYMDFNIAMTDMVAKCRPLMKKRGMSREVVAYINAIDNVFEEAEARVEAAWAAHQKTLPKNERGDTALPFALYEKTMTPIKNKIERLTQKFKESDNTPIESSASYTHVDKRQKLANQCLRTAIDRIEHAKGWEEDIEMISLDFSDANTIVKLGVAILGGNPAKIDQASNMDTACRELLTTQVWDFVTDDLDKLKRASRPGPRR